MSARRRRLPGLLMFLLFALVAILLVNQRWAWRLLYPIRYQAELVQESRRNGIDPFLAAAVVKTESGWRENAVSARGAIGLMQIMPDTGRWAAKQMGIDGFSEDSLYDPAVNLKIGCWYLAELSREFRGDRVIVLAAYNAGMGNVNEWLRSQRWSGEAETVADIPFRETRDFVGRVMATRSRLIWIYGQDFLSTAGNKDKAK